MEPGSEVTSRAKPCHTPLATVSYLNGRSVAFEPGGPGRKGKERDLPEHGATHDLQMWCKAGVSGFRRILVWAWREDRA